MKFREFITLEAVKSAERTAEIDTIFNQASAEIDNLFDQLYKGTSNMVKSYEKAGLPEEIKKSVLKDLGQIARKIQGNRKVAESIEEISKAINEAQSIVQDLGSHGTGLTGKKAYDYKTTLTNVKRMVMEKMAQLKDAVLRHIGVIHNTHSKVLGIRNVAGNIRNKVGDIHSKLTNQPFTPGEDDKAQDSMIALASATSQFGQLQLKAYDGTVIPIDANSEKWKKDVLKFGYQHKIFTLILPNGKEESLNIGNPEQVHNILNSLGLKQTSDFMPAKRRKARTIGLKGPDGKVIK
jgi:hypothetical protein